MSEENLDGLGLRFVSSLLQDSEANMKHVGKVNSELFVGSAKDIYQFILSHVMNYSQLPSLETITHRFKLDLPSADEPCLFYADKLKERHKTKLIISGMDKASKSLQKLDVASAIDAIKKIALLEIQLEQDEGRVVDVSSVADERKKKYQEKMASGGLVGIPTGNYLLDESTGGKCPGDLWITLGRPNMGKTFDLLTAFDHDIKMGYRPLFITMECSVEECLDRLDAIRFNLNWDNFRRGMLTTDQEEKYYEKLDEQKSKGIDRGWWVVGDGAIKDMNDINLYVCQFKPDIVYIDAIYQLGDLSIDDNKRVAYNIITSKKLGLHHRIPFHVSSQLNRNTLDKANKQGSYKANLSNASFSDAVGQNADVAYSFDYNKDRMMNKEMQFSLTKNRRSKKFQFVRNWDFERMDFSLIGELVNGEVVTPDENPEEVPF